MNKKQKVLIRIIITSKLDPAHFIPVEGYVQIMALYMISYLVIEHGLF